MNVLITGASSGIGEALALECAKRGDGLFLCGRDRGRLDAVASACRAAGAALILSHVNEQPLKVMRKAGYLAQLGEGYCVEHIDDALALAAQLSAE